MAVDTVLSSAGNPVPGRMHSGTFAGRGNVRLRYARFEATARPRNGTVILFPGRNEAIEKYLETIGDLQARGFAVAMFDWRGQGGSERPRGRLGLSATVRFDDHVADIDAFMSEIVLPDCRGPFYLVGHSTGALIALHASPSLTNRIRRMVLLAPLLTLERIPVSMSALRRLTGVFTRLGLGSVLLGRGRRHRRVAFQGNVVSSDPVRFERNQTIYEEHPDLAIGATTVGWVHAACQAAAGVQRTRFLRGHRIPTLLVAAGADTLVSTPAIETYAARLRGASILTIDGARHEILQEADRYREQFWAVFDAFVPSEGEGGAEA